MSICKLVIAAMLLASGAPGHAQTYPTRAVRVIVPFPPGGSTDILARAMGQKLSEAWQQQVIIDNRAGAGGIIGTELGARAARDGYTLMMGSGAPLTILPSLYEKLPESGLPGYEAISWFGLVAPAGVPAAIIAKVNTDAVAILKTREMQERLTDQGAQPMPMTPVELAAWIRSETVKWAKIVKLSGAKPE